MWLINAKSLELKEFPSSDAPPYAILSHMWEDEEVSFQKMCTANMSRLESMHGYQKIKRTCQRAVSDSLEWVWIDTCCIDKTSSAELSESINSMFEWYRDCALCYVYLYDVNEAGAVAKSRWFTRGWTLQELLAPPRHCTKFFDQDWREIGTTADLEVTLSEASGIPQAAFSENRFTEFSIAQRMSWAAGRKTTRREDTAYSLLGLFEINMPLLYGEGDRAFARLQEEIMKISDDQTIFAWTMTGDGAHGLLAASPDLFKQCSNIVKPRNVIYRQPHTMTNKGLSLQLRLLRWSYGLFIAALDACIATDMEQGSHPRSEGCIAIFVTALREPEQYARVTLNGCDKVIIDRRKSLRSSIQEVQALFPNASTLAPDVLRLWARKVPATGSRIITPRLLIQQRNLPAKPPQYMNGFWMRKLAPFRDNSKFQYWDCTVGSRIPARMSHDTQVWLTEVGSPASIMLMPTGIADTASTIDVPLETTPPKLGSRRPFRRDPSSEDKPGGGFTLTLALMPSSIPLISFQADSNLVEMYPGRKPPKDRTDVRPRSRQSFQVDHQNGARIRIDNYHIFVEMKKIKGRYIWVVDMIYGAREYQCSVCHHDKKRWRVSSDAYYDIYYAPLLQFRCTVCPDFVCCRSCFLGLDIGPHRAIEKAGADTAERFGVVHQFRAILNDRFSPYEIDELRTEFEKSSRLSELDWLEPLTASSSH